MGIVNSTQIGGESTNAAQTKDIQPAEKKIYEPAGKACCWKSASDYSIRLRQLEIINHAIKVLAKETWMDAILIDFKTVHKKAMMYTDIDEKVPPLYINPMDPTTSLDLHSWDMLANDELFNCMELAHNRFYEFQHYFDTHEATSPETMKKDFDTFLILFKRLRDGLFKSLAQNCEIDS
jgi:hypothetical protein